jgi:hypothetical protein
VLSSGDYTERAQALGEWYRRHGGETVAAETLESFAG